MTPALQSALYLGKLRHRRFSPKEHYFSYPVFMAFLDIDCLPELMRVSRITSYNRFNLISYFEKDHFGDRQNSLRQRLESDAAANGVALPDGKIFLLTHLRYLGYVFNPVSFFYFYDHDGNLQQMMAEVNNTFAESHNYWLTAANEKPNSAARSYSTDKRLHVSPFMGMHLEYDWIFAPPGEKLVAHMNTREDGKAFFDATLQLERREWTSREIARVAAEYPLMTLRVIAAIHWQALQLWRKKVPVFSHPSRNGQPAAQVASAVKIPTEEKCPQ